MANINTNKKANEKKEQRTQIAIMFNPANPRDTNKYIKPQGGSIVHLTNGSKDNESVLAIIDLADFTISVNATLAQPVESHGFGVQAEATRLKLQIILDYYLRELTQIQDFEQPIQKPQIDYLNRAGKSTANQPIDIFALKRAQEQGAQSQIE
jgi:hypothetical protein